MKKMDVRVKRTYSQLIDALFDLLSEKSFDDLTVSEICDKANIHRATFYKHFVDKYVFLNFCFESKLSEIKFKIPDGDSTNTESIKNGCMDIIRQVIDFVEENRKIISVISGEKYSISFSNALTNSVAKFISKNLEAVLRIPGAKVSLISNFYSGAIIGVVKWWVTTEEECSKFDLFNFFECKIDEMCNYFVKVTS